MHKAVTSCLVFSLLIGIFATTYTVQPTSAQTASPFTFESSDCPFEVYSEDTIECGYVTVPENHADPQGDQIRIAVAVLRTTNPNPPSDAVIYLDGGPGGDTLINYGSDISFIFSAFTETRDVVIFDQRGTGFSEPSLDCPEIQALALEYLDAEMSDAERNTLSNEALAACRNRIVEGTNVNLEYFNTIQNAADVDAIRQALGYEQFNLYGISYGTRLALEVMRDFPAGVRSAIIDSAVPLQADFNVDFAQNADRVFDLLFASCESDSACNAAYPNLKQVALDTAAELDANPVLMQTFYQGEFLDDLLDGDYFFTLIFQSLYATSIIPELPRIIYEVSEGNTETLGILAGFFLEDTFSEGVYYTFNCNEEYPFTNMDEAIASFETYAPEYTQFISSDEFVVEKDLLPFCEAWAAGVAPVTENEAVSSDIPTLLVAGEFDPVTPPRYTQLVGETLSNSAFIEIPGAGHGPSLDGGCPTEISGAFVENPTPEVDISCVAQMSPVQFAVSDSASGEPPTFSSVTTVTYNGQELPITSVVPENWIEVEPGIFQLSELFEAPFVGFRLPEDGLDGYIQRIIVGGYGYDELPEPTETIEANGVTWKVYDIVGQGLFTYFAMTEIAEQGSVIVVAGNTPEEREILYEQALKPAIENFALIVE